MRNEVSACFTYNHTIFFPLKGISLLGGMPLNLIALRMAKIAYNFGLFECSRVKAHGYIFSNSAIFLSVLPKNFGGAYSRHFVCPSVCMSSIPFVSVCNLSNFRLDLYKTS